MDSVRPEILDVELAGETATTQRVTWGSSDRIADAVGSYGGSALALAIVHDAVRRGRAAPFVVAAGEAVARGLPTAARACVASIVPLSGQYADGHVGGRSGEHLAAIAGALVVRGRTELEDAVLVVDADGGVSLERVDGVARLAISGRTRTLRARFPGAALLVAGPAGDARIPMASLANEAEPPSFVGRGGLGAVLGGHGLRAIAILPPRERTRRVARAGAPDPSVLLASPRLLARAAGGTFESPRENAVSAPMDPGLRKGCRGCPTPCGWVFERPSGELGARQGALLGARQGALLGARQGALLGARQGALLGARQGAVEALGRALGFAELDGPLALLERCDDLGLDAKEVGAALALLVEHVAEAHALRGDVAALVDVLDRIPARTGLGERVALGAAQLARELGVDAPTVRGQAARPESDLASLLGQCVSTRGADPMRTFAFLAADVPDRARLAQILAPWNLPPGIEDPRDPAGKGRLVAWTESFLAAVDAAGFCAFSAAALLADGVLDLDALARWIAPDSVRATLGEDGRALLAAGATIALLQRELASAPVHSQRELASAQAHSQRELASAPAHSQRELASAQAHSQRELASSQASSQHLVASSQAHSQNEWASSRGDDDRPAFAARELDRPGMLDEYRRFRGLDADGSVTAAAREAAGTRAVLDLHGESESHAVAARDTAARATSRSPGVVVLNARGPLRAALGAPCRVRVDLPAPLVDVLESVAHANPAARAWLVREGTPIPVVTRRGVRIAGADAIRDGDELELVVALSGG